MERLIVIYHRLHENRKMCQNNRSEFSCSPSLDYTFYSGIKPGGGLYIGVCFASNLIVPNLTFSIIIRSGFLSDKVFPNLKFFHLIPHSVTFFTSLLMLDIWLLSLFYNFLRAR